jgi:hypothetical protein
MACPTKKLVRIALVFGKKHPVIPIIPCKVTYQMFGLTEFASLPAWLDHPKPEVSP